MSSVFGAVDSFPTKAKTAFLMDSNSHCYWHKQITRWFWPDLMNGRHGHTTEFASLYHGQEVFVWSDCLLDLGTISLIGSIWSLYEMRSILRQHLISMACILLWSSAVRVHGSKHTGRWMWQGSASVVFWSWAKYSCHSKLVSVLSMLLLSVLSWRVSQAWNPHQL